MSRLFGQPAALFAVALLAAAPLHAARQDGLVLYMNFDSDADLLRNSVSDSPLPPASKFGDSLEIATTEGRFGKALLFTNSTQAAYANCAVDLGKLGDVYSGSFTVACWVKFKSSHNGVILANKESGNAASPGFVVTAGRTNRVSVTSDSGSLLNVTGGESITGAWHHWAMVADRKAGTVGFFLDGKLVDSRSLNGSGTKLDNGLSTMIGAGSDGKNGSSVAVDDVGVWDRALTEKELADLGAGTGKRIPEPGTYGLVAGVAGAAAAFVVRRRRKRA